MKKVATDMNGNYIRFVIRQETLFTDCPVVNPDGMSDEERLISSAIILVMFLLGIPIVQLSTRQSSSLSLQLVRKGVSSAYSLVVDLLLMAISLFGVFVIGLSVFVFALGIDDVSIFFLLPCLLLDSLCGAAFFSVFCSLNQGPAGNVLAIFLVSVVQFFLAGGLFPIYVLPELCAWFGKFLPGGMMMDLLSKGMFYEKWGSSSAFVIFYTLIFFLISLCLKEKKRRNCT